MEFQLLTACLEDRYPKGFEDRDDALFAPSRVETKISIAKEREGCIAFLFGRNAHGQSVCVRMEGVRPTLYFEMKDGDDENEMKRELRDEIETAAGGEHLRFEVRDFCHDYEFEPDPASPSGRRVHRYLEARYPSLSSFRLARRLRREEDLRSMRRRIADVEERLAATREFIRASSQRSMRASSQTSMRGDGEVHSSLRDKFQAAEREAEDTEKRVLPLLRAKERGMAEEFDEEDAEADGERIVPRPAHESFVEPLVRFMQEGDLTPGRWYSCPYSVAERQCTLCHHELVAPLHALAPVDRDLPSPYVACYYDIETTSLNPKSHPVIQISLVFERGEEVEKHILAVGGLDPLPGVVAHSFRREAELLSAFSLMLREKDPDFLIAYNGVNFDNNFLATRASPGHALDAEVEDFFHMSRFPLKRSPLRELRLSSSGMGDNVLRFFELPGRATFDWFVKLKRDLLSEPSYSLNHFARTICGDQKEDMDHREIPVLQRGSDADRARLASYCVHDSYLLCLLNRARTMIIEILQFASVFGIIPEWVYFRGQQVRFVSQLLRKVRTQEEVPLLLNTPPEGFCGTNTFSKFEGATVNDPDRGYFKVPVLVCDWQSLYPSLMRTHNLCHSTWIHPDRAHLVEGAVTHEIRPGTVTHFAPRSVKRGILPVILEELGRERKAAKKELKRYALLFKETGEERNRVMASIFDGKQLAIKVAMNSIYGATGAAESGKYPNLDISSTVTAEGRRAMVVKKTILPQRFPGVRIVYGDTDSVMLTFSDTTTLEEAARRGEEVASFVTDHFASIGQPEMVLEFEKVFYPYLLEDKKRYAGKKYEPDGSGALVPKGIDCKGLETERRDTLPFVKDILKAVLEDLMERIDEARALSTFSSFMDRLVRDEVPFERFIMKKNLSLKVQGKTDTIVQAKVNADRRVRDPGSEAAAGEQVEYVIVNGSRKEKTTHLAEDPKFARERGLKINRLWYFEHAIEEPVRKIFKAFPDLGVGDVFQKYRVLLDAARLNVGDLRSFLSAPTTVQHDVTSRPHVSRPPLPPKRKKKKT